MHSLPFNPSLYDCKTNATPPFSFRTPLFSSPYVICTSKRHNTSSCILCTKCIVCTVKQHVSALADNLLENKSNAKSLAAACVRLFTKPDLRTSPQDAIFLRQKISCETMYARTPRNPEDRRGVSDRTGWWRPRCWRTGCFRGSYCSGPRCLWLC